VLSSVGYIPLENFIGRAGMIFYSYARGTETEAPGIRMERSGRIVR